MIIEDLAVLEPAIQTVMTSSTTALHPRMQKAGYREQQLVVGEVRLNHVRGPANGPPLLLLPGQTQPWQSYSKVLVELSRHFEVVALDIHGHGQSSFVPQRYSFDAIGQDLAVFLQDSFDQPAFVSGNSSGGVLAVWLAAYAPSQICALLLEDPPLFSCEWPRLKQCFVYKLLHDAVRDLADARDVAGFFARLTIPQGGSRAVTAAAGPLLKVVASYVRWMQRRHPGRREVDLPGLPFVLRMMVRGFSGYDAEFSRPFLDGSFGRDFDHEHALRQIQCPVTLLHAVWFEDPTHGLVGAMSDDDIARVQDALTDLTYLPIDSGHVVHQERPRDFVRQLLALKARA